MAESFANKHFINYFITLLYQNHTRILPVDLLSTEKKSLNITVHEFLEGSHLSLL